MSSRVSVAWSQSERARKLSERLNNIQVSFDSDRGSRLDQLEKNFSALEEQLEEFNQQTSLKLNDLREKVSAVQKAVETDRVGREVELETSVRDLEGLEERMHRVIGEGLGLRRDTEMRVLKALDERTASLRSELIKETRAKTESSELLQSSLVNSLSKAQEGFKSCQSDLMVLHKDLISRVDTESRDVTSELMADRKAREDTEEALLAMLKDVVGRIKSDLEQERKERETTEENLLGLLEDACAKLNALTRG
jgi:hypothetical protein